MSPLASLIPTKYLVSAGSLLFAFSFIVSRIFHAPDAVDGFMKGLGIGLMVFGLAAKYQGKQQKAETLPVKSDDSNHQF